jgi:hypothetical protein
MKRVTLKQDLKDADGPRSITDTMRLCWTEQKVDDTHHKAHRTYFVGSVRLYGVTATLYKPGMGSGGDFYLFIRDRGNAPTVFRTEAAMHEYLLVQLVR